MAFEIIEAFGWEHCARLSNAHAELQITLDVGPRILSYSTAGSGNALGHFEDEIGRAGEPGYVARGGHRFWIAPGNERTYDPDNGPVEYDIVGPECLKVSAPLREPWLIRKELTISLSPDDASVTLRHRAINEGTEPTMLAPWGLTFAAPSGRLLIPQPPLRPHAADTYLPNRAAVLWPYSDLSDDRWTIGKRFWVLQPKAGREATKIGLAHRLGWVAYLLPSALFIKRFGYEEGASYPDLGCNFETFSKGVMIEIESLGSFRNVAPGESAEHVETWHLFGGVTPPDTLDEAELEAWLSPYLAQLRIS